MQIDDEKFFPLASACQALELSELRLVSRSIARLSERARRLRKILENSPTMSNEPRPTPSEEEVAALLDCFRYGDLEQDDLGDIQRFAEHYGDEWLANARDDRGNTPLHMAGGNGHLGEWWRITRRLQLVESYD